MIPVSLRQLGYFVAAAEAGTIAGAAASMHVSQSAIALAIGELEKALAVQLFLRKKAKGLTITTAGVSVLADARSVLGHADELVESARSLGTRLTGRLAVGCFMTLAPFLLPAVLEGFAAQHPDLELVFSEGSQIDLQKQLLNGETEVALLYALDLQPGIHHEVLYETQPYVLLPQHHPLTSQPSVDLNALADEPMIMLDYPPSMHYFTDLLASVGVTPRIRHTTASYETVRSFVARGLGYSLLIQRPASQVSYEGLPLAHCRIDQDLPAMPVLLAWPEGAKLTRRASAFVASCHEMFHAGPILPRTS